MDILLSCPTSFSPTGKLLQVNTGDREVLYFEAPRGKQHFIPQDTIETLTWSTWTCVLGPSVQGVWPPYTDVTDINAASVSSDGEVIATGDDFGFVKIFKFPSHVSEENDSFRSVNLFVCLFVCLFGWLV